MNRRRDGGFTLPEVLVTVVLIGLIAGVLTTVFTTVVRTRPAAEARADDARSLLGITTWFPGDVNSTPRQPAASASPEWWNIDPSASSGCTGAPAGTSTNLIRLRWTETSGATTKYEASYRFVDDGGWRIKRVSCVVGQSAEVLTATSELPAGPPVPVSVSLRTDSVTGDVIGASMVITTNAGDSIRVDASTESPNETLPPVPTAVTTTAVSTTSTTTTTTTTTTTVPPSSTSSTSSTTSTTSTSTTTTVPCSVSSLTAAPNPVQNQPKSNGNNDTESQLSELVTVTVVTAGDCSGLQLRYSFKSDPYPPGQQLAQLFGGSTTITLLPVATERWQDGPHTMTLYDTLRSTSIGPSTVLVVT